VSFAIIGQAKANSVLDALMRGHLQSELQRYCTHLASTAMQYWIEEEPMKANYMKKPELFQPIEKNGKYVSSIASSVCRPQTLALRVRKIIK
jgi:hypothetical protein